MRKAFAWAALAVFGVVLSFGGPQAAGQAQALQKVQTVAKPILKPDLIAVLLEFQLVSNSIANGR